jgi:hypothetical protein
MMTYYHLGTSCSVCQFTGDTFWSELWARYDFAPRAAERRHFRGAAGKKAIVAWREMFKTPEKFMIAVMRPSFMGVYNANIPQIGQYFSWKACDLRQYVFGYDVDWTNAENNLVGLPQSGLKMLFPDEKPSESVWKVVDAIKHLKEPPKYTGNCGLSSGETVSCMVSGYFKNKTPIGHDIVDKRNALKGYGELAKHLLSVMPTDPQDKDFV